MAGIAARGEGRGEATSKVGTAEGQKQGTECVEARPGRSVKRYTSFRRGHQQDTRTLRALLYNIKSSVVSTSGIWNRRCAARPNANHAQLEGASGGVCTQVARGSTHSTGGTRLVFPSTLPAFGNPAGGARS